MDGMTGIGNEEGRMRLYCIDLCNNEEVDSNY